jgi:transcriptional regulator with XRE-family HTH domain
VREVSEHAQRIRRRVAAQVRRLRAARGLTQEAAAERARLATRHLQKIEAAEVNVTLDTLVRVAEAFDVDVRALLDDGNAGVSQDQVT